MSNDLRHRVSTLNDGNALPSTIQLITDLLDRVEALELDNTIKQKEIDMLHTDLDLLYDYDSNLLDALRERGET